MLMSHHLQQAGAEAANVAKGQHDSSRPKRYSSQRQRGVVEQQSMPINELGMQMMQDQSLISHQSHSSHQPVESPVRMGHSGALKMSSLLLSRKPFPFTVNSKHILFNFSRSCIFSFTY